MAPETEAFSHELQACCQKRFHPTLANFFLFTVVGPSSKIAMTIPPAELSGSGGQHQSLLPFTFKIWHSFFCFPLPCHMCLYLLQALFPVIGFLRSDAGRLIMISLPPVCVAFPTSKPLLGVVFLKPYLLSLVPYISPEPPILRRTFEHSSGAPTCTGPPMALIRSLVI